MFPFQADQLYQLSESLGSPWLKFPWHISFRDLRTPHSGGKASLSPSCGVQEIKVQWLNSSQRVTGHVSPRSSLDEKLGHGTLNLFAVSRLQLDLLEVSASALTTFLRRKQHLSILLSFLFLFIPSLKYWAGPVLCAFSCESPDLLCLSESITREKQDLSVLWNCCFPSVCFQAKWYTLWMKSFFHSFSNKELIKEKEKKEKSKHKIK